MLIVKRFLVFGLPFLIFLVYLLSFWRAGWYYDLFLVSLIITLFSFWYLLGRKLSLTDFLNFLFSPIFFIGSSLLFFTFLESLALKVILIFLVVCLIFMFYNKIFQEFYKNQIWQLKSFKSLVYYLQILSIWFLASAFFGLIIFINFSTVLALGLLILILLIFFGQFIWFNELMREEKLWIVYTIFSAVFIESAVVVNLLPLSLYFKGLLITVIYYLFSQGFLASKSSGTLSNKYFVRNFIIILILIAMILAFNFINL